MGKLRLTETDGDVADWRLTATEQISIIFSSFYLKKMFKVSPSPPHTLRVHYLAIFLTLILPLDSSSSLLLRTTQSWVSLWSPSVRRSPSSAVFHLQSS